MTYRLSGHSTSDDPRAYRLEDEVTQWRKADPVLRLRRHLETLGAITEADDARLRADAEAEIKTCIEVAEATPRPSLESLFEDVYAEQPWHLREQARECVEGPRPKAHH